MPTTNHSPATQVIRDHARREHWKKFDTIVTTLIAMDASPTDLEERLQSVLGGKFEQGEKVEGNELQGAVANPDLNNLSNGRTSAPKSDHDPMIKLEDDEEQARSLNEYKTNHVYTTSATSVGQRKRKSTMNVGTGNRTSKRLANGSTGDHSGSQQSENVGSEGSQDPCYEPPCHADRAPAPAAHVYRDKGGVYVRRPVGWQFRDFKGTTKVWYGGKWQPLIQDQPSFIGVCEAEGGWILPIMALSRYASLERRKRWDEQGKVEFNSPF